MSKNTPHRHRPAARPISPILEALEERQFLSTTTARVVSGKTLALRAAAVTASRTVSGKTLALRAARPAAATTALSIGANVDATRLAGNQVETEIAVNPTNPNNLITIGLNQANNESALVVSRSFDGGKTWSISSLGANQDRLSAGTSRVDPHVTFDSFGNAYATYEVAASRSELRIIVARSSDGGATWSASTAVAGQGLDIDFPFIGTGPDATNLARQTVWVGFTDTKTNTIKMVAARSAGLGNLGAFTAPVAISNHAGSYGSVAVGPGGEVAVAWQTNPNGQGPASIYMDIDRDGLGSAFNWGADTLAAATNVGGFDYIPAQPDRSIYSNLQLAFDRAPASSTRGRLFLAYTDENGNESNNTDIILRSTDNLGGTWSGKLVVNDDASGKSQFLPAMAVDQTTGNVAIVWHDARNSKKNNTAQIFGTVSINHGASVMRNVLIGAGASSQAGASRYSVDDMDFGDYAGIAFHAGKFVAVWADNSNATGTNPDGAGNALDLMTAGVTLV